MVESTECEVVAAILVDVNSPFCLSLFAFHLRKFLANPSNRLEIVLILRTFEVVEDHACSVVGTCSTVKLDYIRLTLLEFEFWRDQPVASCRTCVRTHECRWFTSEVRSVELPCLARNIAVVESRPCSELVGRVECDFVRKLCCHVRYYLLSDREVEDVAISLLSVRVRDVVSHIVVAIFLNFELEYARITVVNCVELDIADRLSECALNLLVGSKLHSE